MLTVPQKEIELVESGSTLPVTKDNKHKYVQALPTYRLTGCIKLQTDAFLDGLSCCFPRSLLQMFSSVSSIKTGT